MQDTGKMTDEELAKELDAFYDFVRVSGYQYLNEEGLTHFNALRGEYVRRNQEIGTLKYGYEEVVRGLPPMPAPPDAALAQREE